MTTENCKTGATTLPRTNFSGYVWTWNYFSWLFTITCC